jgi:glycosyltransferase involved in cell wall biosynthesis
MRVLIDGTALLLRSAGVKTYSYHWIESLRRGAGHHHLSVFPYIGSWQPLDHEHSQLNRWSTETRLALVRFANLGRNPALSLLVHGWDLFHCSPNLLNPPSRMKLTATLHDMTCWILPGTHTPENVAATKLHAERVLARADGIIAVSEASRADALRILHIPEHKIRCIYPVVPESYYAAGQEQIAAACERFRLERPYLLYVGGIEPRKNVDRLLDAYAALPKSLREQYELLVAGPALWGSSATVRRLSAEPGVRYLGYVPEQSLPGLTAGAYALVCPSLYEGFGLPLAQAMAAGVPAIASRTSSLPEVGGPGALYIDPYSVEDIRGAIERLCLSHSLRAGLAGCARGHAERFRWEHSAAKAWEFFEQVCS